MKWNQYPINKVAFESRNYPSLLKRLKDPPRELYYRGTWDNSLFKKSLAVVGSRRSTSYGERVCDQLILGLVMEKVTIVSGFMYGIDSLAHQKTLEFGGKTVAVLGGGLDILYPPENEKLYLDIIASGGLIISEYPADQQPQLWTFPRRNRIVAGLSSLGVLVIEAGKKSGSLITAELARKLKKPTFAVPGPITSSTSAGTNGLIKEGLAKMVLCAGDIIKISALKTTKTGIENQSSASDVEQKILAILSAEPLTLDEIARKLSINIIETSQTLTMMTIKNTVEEKNGKYYPGN